MKPFTEKETKENVVALNTEPLVSKVSKLIDTYPMNALKNKMNIEFSGFNNVKEELFDIPEFKLFARKLFEEAPLILYLVPREIACILLTSIFEIENRELNGPVKRVQVSITLEDHFRYQDALMQTKLTRMEIQDTLTEYFSRGILDKSIESN